MRQSPFSVVDLTKSDVSEKKVNVEEKHVVSKSEKQQINVDPKQGRGSSCSSVRCG